MTGTGLLLPLPYLPVVGIRTERRLDSLVIEVPKA
jgi:hypothetical protein